MANSYNVNKLPAYVDQHKTDLIAKSIIGFNSAKYFTLLTGVKGDTSLNLIDTDLTIQDGSTCGWTEQGATSLSQRVLQPAFLKVNMAICDKSLLNKYAGYLVRIAADKTDRDLPFEEEFTDNVVAKLNEKLEWMIWEGNNDEGRDKNEFNGLVTIISQDPGTIKLRNTYDDKGFNDVYFILGEVIKKLPAAVKAKNDVVVFCARYSFEIFMQQLVEKNLYHYNPGQGDNEYYYPGTRVKIIACDTLDNIHYIGCSLSNIFLGVDMLNGQEVFDLWYSKDAREFRLAIEFAMGVQVAYPNEIVYYNPENS